MARGREKMIKDPEDLWDLFESYRKDVKTNPRKTYEYHGKDGSERKKPLERPLTMVGFYNFARRKIGTIHQYFENAENAYTDFLGICRAIKEEVRQDQIEGGMVGQYSTSITQRLNGLKEQTEQTHSHKPIFGENPLSD